MTKRDNSRATSTESTMTDDDGRITTRGINDVV